MSKWKETRFDWPVCYPAEELLLERLLELVGRNAFARDLAERMPRETGTLLLDWVDHLVLPARDEPSLRNAGFVDDALAEPPGSEQVLYHPSAMLPHVLVSATEPESALTAALRVESLEDFSAVHGLPGKSVDEPLSRFRRLLVSEENQTRLEAVERRGYRGFRPAKLQTGEAERLLEARRLWQQRRRLFEDSSAGYREALSVLAKVLELVGSDLACAVVFEGERAYWQSRNLAGQAQKQRQDRLGLGWANHDHHTFRSSRERFVDLMTVMERIGLERRERYYAGAQAGWGAQILEHPVEKIVVFADVDLMPDETGIDFSRHPLEGAPRLGTVGLWVGLHGESLLEAGMHHLEARFDFELVREQLKALSIGGMPPFSDFEFLKQAFTEGERWPVRPERAEKLLRAELITEQQFRTFVKDGAIGSHLETLQRRGGFKGFNQKAVSAIISATDPRNSPSVAA